MTVQTGIDNLNEGIKMLTRLLKVEGRVAVCNECAWTICSGSKGGGVVVMVLYLGQGESGSHFHEG